MTDVIRLENMTRIEGHGRVTLRLDEAGTVDTATFDALEFRGFERFLEGRMVWEMPLLTSRVCGICPVSHHVAAVLAVEDLFGVTPPDAAAMQRELLHLAGIVQDHALHFFFLAGPDFLTGGGASRDLLGVVEAHPELAREAIALRAAAQRIVELVGGRPGQPVTCIPGGMSRALDAEMLAELRTLVASLLAPSRIAERLARDATLRLLAEHHGFGETPFASMALTTDDAALSFIGSRDLRLLSADGAVDAAFDVADYADYLAEAPSPTGFALQPYVTELGPQAGRYRVGPLARMNVVDRVDGEHASIAFAEWRETMARPEHRVLSFHWARMIELVAAAERMAVLVSDPEIGSEHVRIRVDRFDSRGVGAAAIEAPRGTLIHRYEADPTGRVTAVDLRVATTHNARSIDAAVLEAVDGLPSSEATAPSAVTRMELGIRAHDPCLSCATHEIGAMPLEVRVVDAEGALVAREVR